MKLNLESYNNLKAGFINTVYPTQGGIPEEFAGKVFALDYTNFNNPLNDVKPEPGKVEAILARNVLELMTPDVIGRSVCQWYHYLMPGGVLILTFTDIRMLANVITNGLESKDINETIFGVNNRNASVVDTTDVKTLLLGLGAKIDFLTIDKYLVNLQVHKPGA